MDNQTPPIVEKPNELSLPIVILIASVILGGSYYGVQVNKQKSIEKQQQIELQAKERQQQAELQAKADADKAVADQKNIEKTQKALCVKQAEQRAIEYYKDVCTYDCKEGHYLTATYDANYSQCLERLGLK